MPTLHITEEELARDLGGYLDKARRGDEVVVQDVSNPAVRLSRSKVGRTFSEMLARIPKHSPVGMQHLHVMCWTLSKVTGSRWTHQSGTDRGFLRRCRCRASRPHCLGDGRGLRSRFAMTNSRQYR